MKKKEKAYDFKGKRILVGLFLAKSHVGWVGILGKCLVCLGGWFGMHEWATKLRASHMCKFIKRFSE